MRLAPLVALLVLLVPALGSAQTIDAIGGVLVRGPGVVTVANRWFHLLGVEAPDADATCDRNGVKFDCGVVAMAKLAELANGKIMHCRLQQFAGDARWWGTCIPYDPGVRGPSTTAPSVNQEWVRSGWARAHTLHTDVYAGDEAVARTDKRGLWLSAWPASPAANGTAAEGPARVLDANTLVIGTIKVRLDGIDAPEIEQACRVDGRAYGCGDIALGALMDMVMGKRIACTLRRQDGDDRAFGTCREVAATDGPTINERMVQSGWAVADRRTGERFVPLETAASRQRAGLWSGPFVPPSRWRAGDR